MKNDPLGDRMKAYEAVEAARAQEAFLEETIKYWLSATEFISSPTTMMELPSFKAIVDGGSAAVPIVLKRLKEDPQAAFLYLALQRLTGGTIDLQEQRGKTDVIVEKWIAEGEEWLRLRDKVQIGREA